MMGSARRVSYEKGDGRDVDSLVHSEFLGTWPRRSGRHRQRCECNLTSSQRRRIDPLWKKDMASRISTCARFNGKGKGLTALQRKEVTLGRLGRNLRDEVEVERRQGAQMLLLLASFVLGETDRSVADLEEALRPLLLAL